MLFCKKEPKTNKIYEITYTTIVWNEKYKSIVVAPNEVSAIEKFRQIGTQQRYSDIVCIKPYEMEESE